MKKILFFLALFITIAVTSAEEVYPKNPDLFWRGHPTEACDYCHYTYIPHDRMTGLMRACVCHKDPYTTGGKVDISKVSEHAHASKPCSACHFGTARVEDVSLQDFHRTHIHVNCTYCHSREGSSIGIPETKNCEKCHNQGPHLVHGERTDAMCVICHGKFGEECRKKGYTAEKIAPVNETTQKTIKIPTILDLLRTLLEIIERSIT